MLKKNYKSPLELGWGGKRIGAGRPVERDSLNQRKQKHSLYCTGFELEVARELLILLREKKYNSTINDCIESLHKKINDNKNATVD